MSMNGLVSMVLGWKVLCCIKAGAGPYVGHVITEFSKSMLGLMMLVTAQWVLFSEVVVGYSIFCLELV